MLGAQYSMYFMNILSGMTIVTMEKKLPETNPV